VVHGLNRWGIKAEPQPLGVSFDLKVDFFAWGNFVTLNRKAGERRRLIVCLT